MAFSFSLRSVGIVVAFSTAVAWSYSSRGITIVSGPSCAKAPNAPLAGLLTLSTDVDSRVSVMVNDGTRIWQRSFHDYRKEHSVPLLGFKPDRTSLIFVTITDKRRNTVSAEPLIFVTDPLPANFPKSVLLTNQPNRMEPGYTLFRVQNRNGLKAYLTIVDDFGEVVWYSGVPSAADVRQLENGNLLVPLATGLVEVNMLGNTVRTLRPPAGLPVNIHDGVPTDHGTILYLSDGSRVLTNFPTSATDPNAPLRTASVLYNKVVEISAADGSWVKTWSPIDVLDPYRLTYLTFNFRNALGWDIQHANAVLEDPRDDSLIVSMRHQNAVIKFSRATGQLKWILGPHENWSEDFQQYLLTPEGEPFEWHYGQHAPMITPHGTLLLFDNGNLRAIPYDPPVLDADTYSRAVEYAIDETNMTVSQVWDYGSNTPERLFSPIIGKAQWLTNKGNVLSTFGYVTYVNGAAPSQSATNATMSRIVEVTHDPIPEVVFDLAYWDYGNTTQSYLGNFLYRAWRVPDLYAHPALPVADLALTYYFGLPLLQFSGDSTRAYLVEASTDLEHWQPLGWPLEEEEPGNFQFLDLEGAPVSYYRVVTW